MHTPSLADYMGRIYRDDWPGVGELMLASANKLARVGADFLIGNSNEPTSRISKRRGALMIISLFS